MFGSKDKYKKQEEPTSTPPPIQKETTSQPSSAVKNTQTTTATLASQTNKMETLISDSCTIEGNIKSEQSIKIDGKVEGDIDVKDTVIVSDSGRVVGNITAKSLVVFGTINGDSQLESIHIQSGGHIDGNIKTQSLKVDPNATYNGVITMTQESIKSTSITANNSTSKKEATST